MRKRLPLSVIRGGRCFKAEGGSRSSSSIQGTGTAPLLATTMVTPTSSPISASPAVTSRVAVILASQSRASSRLRSMTPSSTYMA